MYDSLVSFVGSVPDYVEPFLYLACIPFTLYLVDLAYSLVRIIISKGVG